MQLAAVRSQQAEMILKTRFLIPARCKLDNAPCPRPRLWARLCNPN